MPDERGGYKYTSADRTETRITPKMRQIFANSVLSINFANNLIVIRTLAGSASTIGVVADALKHPAILGCVAGDDTVLVVVASNEDVPDVVDRLSLMLSFPLNLRAGLMCFPARPVRVNPLLLIH